MEGHRTVQTAQMVERTLNTVAKPKPITAPKQLFGIPFHPQ